MCSKGCFGRQMQALLLILMTRLQVRKQIFIAMADEVTIYSMMADIITWCCWRFDSEAQRTVPLRSQQASQPDQYQMLREELEQAATSTNLYPTIDNSDVYDEFAKLT